MAVIDGNTQDLPGTGRNSNQVILWDAMKLNDTGNSWAAPQWADRNVQVIGTFGAAGNLKIEGSNVAAPNTDSDWSTLNDIHGVALDFTAPGFREICEVPRWIRPRVSAGDGTTLLKVMMMVRRTG